MCSSYCSDTVRTHLWGQAGDGHVSCRDGMQVKACDLHSYFCKSWGMSVLGVLKGPSR
jgi:hypothetical protein